MPVSECQLTNSQDYEPFINRSYKYIANTQACMPPQCPNMFILVHTFTRSLAPLLIHMNIVALQDLILVLLDYINIVTMLGYIYQQMTSKLINFCRRNMDSSHKLSSNARICMPTIAFIR